VVQGDPVAGSRGHALPARPPGGRRRWAAKAARAPRARTTSRRRAGRLTRRPARACPNPTLTPGSAARRARSLTGIFLAVTGTEASYADLGHFSRPAIQARGLGAR